MKLYIIAILQWGMAIQAFNAVVPRKLGVGSYRKAGVVVRRAADEGGSDLPSDTSVADENVEGYNQPYVANDEDRRAIKSEIFRIGATTDRGQVRRGEGMMGGGLGLEWQLASENEKLLADELLNQLIYMNPSYDLDFTKLRGSWDLVYANVQPFRSSPFFMLLGKLLDEYKLDTVELFDLHRSATGGSEIGRVRQVFTDAQMTSEVDLNVGVIPGLPFNIRGTVVSTAETKPEPTDTSAMLVDMKSTRVTNNNILRFLDNLVDVPVEEFVRNLRGDVPSVKVNMVYLDDDTRVAKVEDGSTFVYSKVE